MSLFNEEPTPTVESLVGGHCHFIVLKINIPANTRPEEAMVALWSEKTRRTVRPRHALNMIPDLINANMRNTPLSLSLPPIQKKIPSEMHLNVCKSNVFWGTYTPEIHPLGGSSSFITTARHRWTWVENSYVCGWCTEYYFQRLHSQQFVSFGDL